MFIGHLNHPETYHPLLSQEPWLTALAWLEENATTQEDGEYAIDDRNVFAIVQTLTTIPRKERIFEAHKNYIDIHYCVTGEEIIEWAPVNSLTPKGEFNVEKDYGHYQVPDQCVQTHFTTGVFGIYLPADAHMPKIAVTSPAPLKKVVIKIRVS